MTGTVAKHQKIPSSPGVYFFKGQKEQALYIGKAANLKNRLNSYRKAGDPRILKMLKKASRISWQETGSEIEALLLESRLIKKLRPMFNIMLRDDKQYFYVGITKEEFPRIFLTHQPTNPKLSTKKVKPFLWITKSEFIGPFTEGASLKSTLKLLRRIFPYCTCKQKHHRYCLNYHLGNCLGFCCLKESYFSHGREKSMIYQKNIRAIRNILNGQRFSVLKNLEREMNKSAEKHEFEKAIELRRKLNQLQTVFENARVIRIMNQESEIRDKTLKEMQKLLGLERFPSRIEGYDISNIQGQFATGSMVVFTDGHPDKNEYRKFKIRNVPPDQGGDVAMLKEILTRRFNRPEWPLPDLILVDGGKAQLNIAVQTINNKLSTINCPVIALTKDKRHQGSHIFIQNKKDCIALQDLPLSVKNLILQIDSEAHRFAISYYRHLHRKKLVSTSSRRRLDVD